MTEGEKAQTVRLRIRGRVQGVGFRWFVQRRAAALGLVGSVRNLPDGTVEILASGDGDSLEEFERLVRQGPQLARVDHVEKDDNPPDIAYHNAFTIK